MGEHPAIMVILKVLILKVYSRSVLLNRVLLIHERRKMAIEIPAKINFSAAGN